VKARSFTGQAFWLTRPDAEQNPQFLLNVLHWLAERRKAPAPADGAYLC